MTAAADATSVATWVAIDIAKRHHAVLIESPDGKHRCDRASVAYRDAVSSTSVPRRHANYGFYRNPSVATLGRREGRSQCQHERQIAQASKLR
jgi:hypothetical protein